MEHDPQHQWCFFEPYEVNAWRARKESAQITNQKWVADSDPMYGPTVLNTMTGIPVATKSGIEWNGLLLARAAAFSAATTHNNLFQSNPFPTQYTVPVTAVKTASKRWFFNARACAAFVQRGVPVRINQLEILP